MMLNSSPPPSRQFGWLLTLVSLDLLFLPMFHFGEIPFKPSYFLMLLYLPSIWRTSAHRNYTTPLLLLAILVWIGLFTFWWYFEFQFTRTTSLTYSIGFVLSASGFAFGYAYYKKSLDFVIFLCFSYAILNVYLWLYYDSSPRLIQFYYLESWVENGVFEARNMGIMFNPNVSAMGAMLLIIFFAIGYEKGLLTYNSLSWIVSAFGATWIVILTFMSRGSLIMLALLTVYFFVKHILGRRLLKFAVIIFCFLGCMMVYATYNQGFSRILDAIYTWVPNSSPGFLDIDRTPSSNSILRPVQKIEVALNRFLYSPVWGTSAEMNNQYPFNDSAYHNDLLVILAGQGFLGLLAYVVLCKRAYKISALTLLLFLNGLVNSFVFLVSHFMFFSIMLGYFYGNQCQLLYALNLRNRRAA
jgi:hypothetical protein